MKKIAADINYLMFKGAGFGDLKDFGILYLELQKYILAQGLHPLVDVITIYKHGGELLKIYNEEKGVRGNVPDAFAAVVRRMMELKMLGHKKILDQGFGVEKTVGTT